MPTIKSNFVHFYLLLFFVLQHLNSHSQITYTNISLRAITMPQHVRYNTYNGNVISEMYTAIVSRSTHYRTPNAKNGYVVLYSAAKMCSPNFFNGNLQIYFIAFNKSISRDVNMCDKHLHVCLCVPIRALHPNRLSAYHHVITLAQNESLCRALLMPHYNNLAQLCVICNQNINTLNDNDNNNITNERKKYHCLKCM